MSATAGGELDTDRASLSRVGVTRMNWVYVVSMAIGCCRVSFDGALHARARTRRMCVCVCVCVFSFVYVFVVMVMCVLGAVVIPMSVAARV